MNKVRKFQLYLLAAMLILIAIVIGNINRGSKQQTVNTPVSGTESLPAESGSTRMESGIHILYRNGKSYATLHFKEAVQSEGIVNLTLPVLEMAGITGKLTARSAELKGEAVLLRGTISLSSAQDGISVSFAPPANFKDGILSGAGPFQAILNNGVFKGQGYVVKMADSELIAKNHAQFYNSRDGILIRGEAGIASLKKKTLTFVKGVRLTTTGDMGFESIADAVFVNTGTGRLSMVGRGEIILSPHSIARFSETTLWRNSGMWNGTFPGPVCLQESGRVTRIPGATLKNDELTFPWSVVQSQGTFVSTGEGSYSLRNSKLYAKAPYGHHEATSFRGKDISGAHSTKDTNILLPVIRKAGLGWVTGNEGILEQNGNFEMNGSIHGANRNRQFLADSAYIASDAIQLTNAIIWDEDSRSFSSAGMMKVQNKEYSATGHYQMTQLRGKGEPPMTLSSENATGREGGFAHLFGNVQATMEEVAVKAPQAYVYEWGAIFLDAHFSGLQIKKGRADLLIVMKKQHVVLMLGNADVTDKNGNRITGHKLTLSTITGRISVYSGKKKVRIQLAL
jgi:lipopolysaccharide export system protein LptA